MSTETSDAHRAGAPALPGNAPVPTGTPTGTGAGSDLDASMRRHPAGKRLSPEAAARIAARSICPTCDGREAAPGEETYATCIFCATGTTKPALPDPALTAAADAATPTAPVIALAAPTKTTARTRRSVYVDPFSVADEPLALD